MSTTTKNASHRIHRDLARAEKALIYAVVWDQPIEIIQCREQRVKRLHQAWKHSQGGQR